MIDPRSLYIVYKQQENELMTQIEHKRAARESGRYTEIDRPWYFAARKWLKDRVFSRMPSQRQPVTECTN